MLLAVLMPLFAENFPFKLKVKIKSASKTKLNLRIMQSLAVMGENSDLIFFRTRPHFQPAHYEFHHLKLVGLLINVMLHDGERHNDDSEKHVQQDEGAEKDEADEEYWRENW